MGDTALLLGASRTTYSVREPGEFVDTFQPSALQRLSYSIAEDQTFIHNISPSPSLQVYL